MGGELKKSVVFMVYFVIATMPILFGAVRPWVWSVYTVMIFLAYVLTLWQGGFPEHPGTGKVGRIILGLFFAWSIFQIVPLFQALLEFLSPVKQGNATQAFSLIEEPLIRQSLSYSVCVSFAKTAFYLGLLLFYFIFSRVIRDKNRFKTMVILMMVLGVSEALYGIVQTLVPAVGVLWVDSSYANFGMARGTYINRNSFAGFIEMVMPITLGYAMAMSYWPVRGKFKKILAQDRLNHTVFMAMMIMLMLLALVFSQSRAGIMGGAVAILLFIIITRTANRQKTIIAWILVIVITALFFLYGFVMGFEPVIERFLGISKDTSRLDIWKDTLAIIKDHPFGVGLGNYERVYPAYHVHFSPHYRVLDAHNDYLQFLAESGWPGFALLAGGFLYFMGSRFRRIINMDPETDPFSFFITAGALCGLAAIFFHSFFDFNLQIPANEVYFVALVVMANGSRFTSSK